MLEIQACLLVGIEETILIWSIMISMTVSLSYLLILWSLLTWKTSRALVSNLSLKDMQSLARIMGEWCSHFYAEAETKKCCSNKCGNSCSKENFISPKFLNFSWELMECINKLVLKDKLIKLWSVKEPLQGQGSWVLLKSLLKVKTKCIRVLTWRC